MGGAGSPMASCPLTTLTYLALTTEFSRSTDLDTAVDGNGTLSNDLLVTSADAGYSGEGGIAVGSMAVSRVNAESK